MRNQVVKKIRILSAIVAPIGVILFVLALLTSGTIAWFNTQTNPLGPQDMTFAVMKEELSIKNEIYQYNEETRLYEQSRQNSYVLGIYDTVFVEQNQTNSLILHVTIYGLEPGEVMSNIHFSVVSNPAHTDPTEYYMSNVVHVKYDTASNINRCLQANSKATLDNRVDDDDLCRGVKYYFDTVSESADNCKSFVTKQNDDYVKQSILSCNCRYDASDLFDASGLELYIEIDYDKDLVSNMAHDDDSILISGNAIICASDITDIIFD